MTYINNTKKLAIIGAGPGGLATARVFLRNCPQYRIDLFEKQSSIGGVWNYDDNNKDGKVMYDHLETNICKQLMQFSDFPFPEDVSTFPKRKDVLHYLKSYYEKFLKNKDNLVMHLETKVENIEKVETESKWRITTINLSNKETKTELYDYVIVSNGHYEYCNFPTNILGMKESLEEKMVFHSKDFQNCQFAKDKTVVVIGNGSSGQDIVVQLATVAKKVYNSVNELSKNDMIHDLLWEMGCVEFVPKIVECDAKTHTVSLLDGRVINDIDYIICATGYKYNFPFMEKRLKNILLTNNPNGDIASDSGSGRVYNLWEQILYTNDHSIGFILLSQMIIPFPLAELQAAVLSQVFENKIHIPHTFKPDNNSESYHSFPELTDIEYYRHLQKLLDDTNYDPTSNFKPVKWDTYHRELRSTSKDNKTERNKMLIKHAKILREKGLPYKLIPIEEDELEKLA
ncbi:hypothetical protein TPHA_0H01230 [Tetrapisispora phaffii CBS 4417]|uniref:Flavin-containing monooxygenase n=1 Tax=Tetrapisispora phaffii (strain ATCC 24235 / CBS 4417 / NBRC 1672 / NRRL Y-8282 / UCD 70-5) TaxID=1071381 RepID=G8BX27_TETPH|nr:hypothetical protein TPHA_0H01230 [Tetrapisispora phaffii CBS 4417]CCE64331.1 hypothetical protein TPHA_0H01230 [Tetrapisispora phaffii CBS 4417]